MNMTYEAWRASFQDSEQAARAAYEAAAKHAAERDAIAAWAEEAHRELSACQSVTHQLAHHGEMCWDYSRDAKAVLDRKPEISLAQRDASMQAKGARLVATRAWERTQWEPLGATPQEQAGNLATIVANELSRSAVEPGEGGAA